MIANQPHSDQELLARLRNGDTNAFQQLYDFYWPQLFTYVMRTVRSSADAEDIIQELFSSLWRRRGELVVNGSLAAYLFSSARYMSITFIRQHLHRPEYLDSLSAVFDPAMVSEADMELRMKELQQQLYRAIDLLPPRMKEVFLLSRIQQFSQKEIATQLRLSEQTVKKQIQSALKVIRASLGQLRECVVFFLL